MFLDNRQELDFILTHNRQFLNKILTHHSDYFDNSALYSAEQKSTARKTLNAVFHKHTLILIHLELLWKRSERLRTEVLLDYKNSISSHQWDDTEKAINSLQLESFLFQIRALLNVYQVYCSQVLGNSKKGNIKRVNSTKEFEEFLDKVEEPFKGKAENIKAYFNGIIYGKGWGELTRSMRDKIAHYNYLQYAYDGTEVVHETLLNWPTLNTLTYERFGQEIETGVFYMLRNVSEMLYDIEWQSG